MIYLACNKISRVEVKSHQAIICGYRTVYKEAAQVISCDFVHIDVGRGIDINTSHNGRTAGVDTHKCFQWSVTLDVANVEAMFYLEKVCEKVSRIIVMQLWG